MLTFHATPPAAAVKTYIERRYADLNKTFETLDAKRFAVWMKANAAPNFFYRTIGGRSYTAKTLDSLIEAEFAQVKSVIRPDYRLTNFSIHPKESFCTASHHLVLLLKDGKKLHDDSVAINSWLLIDGKWKILSIVETKASGR